MADVTPTQIWMSRLLFAGLAFALIVFQLLPLDTRPSLWASPDLLLAFTLVWVARRPDYLPVFAIAVIFLITDLLFQRPPGLWAAMVVILSETLRKNSRDIRNMPIAVEWGTVAVGIVMITLANRLVLAIVMTPQAPLGLTLIQMMFTILAYPLCVVIAHFIFGISRPAPGERDSRGNRL